MVQNGSLLNSLSSWAHISPVEFARRTLGGAGLGAAMYPVDRVARGVVEMDDQVVPACLARAKADGVTLGVSV